MGPLRQRVFFLLLAAMLPILSSSVSHLLRLPALAARNPSSSSSRLLLLSVLPASSPLRAFCSAAMADADDSSSNPLLADFEFPPFDAVQPAHVRPGIRALLARLVRSLVPDPSIHANRLTD